MYMISHLLCNFSAFRLSILSIMHNTKDRIDMLFQSYPFKFLQNIHLSQVLTSQHGMQLLKDYFKFKQRKYHDRYGQLIDFAVKIKISGGINAGRNFICVG